MRHTLLVSCLLLTTGLLGQNSVPAGTILPVRLNSSINTREAQPQQIITARVMQDVPLVSGGKIRAGSKVIGHVLALGPANGSGSAITLRFDLIEMGKQRISITTNLRALASMLEVDQAQIPAFGADRGTSSQSWTTQQIGGDTVYRGGGPVTKGELVVGVPAVNGVLVQPSARPGTPCERDVEENGNPQALWVFSADACGVYGYPKLTIVHAGRSDPIGEIQLSSPKSAINLRNGSGLLLSVQ